jgi:hypothetical protein
MHAGSGTPQWLGGGASTVSQAPTTNMGGTLLPRPAPLLLSVWSPLPRTLRISHMLDGCELVGGSEGESEFVFEFVFEGGRRARHADAC